MSGDILRGYALDNLEDSDRCKYLYPYETVIGEEVLTMLNEFFKAHPEFFSKGSPPAEFKQETTNVLDILKHE